MTISQDLHFNRKSIGPVRMLKPEGYLARLNVLPGGILNKAGCFNRKDNKVFRAL